MSKLFICDNLFLIPDRSKSVSSDWTLLYFTSESDLNLLWNIFCTITVQIGISLNFLFKKM